METTTDRGINLQQVQEQFGPILLALGQILATVEPVIDSISAVLRRAWQALEPYHPEDLLSCMYGLVLVFFGGVYMTIIAAIEAINIFGWDKIKISLITLHHNYQVARRAYEEDDKKDDNRDGVADVRQMSPQELAARKFMIVTKSIDPAQVSNAIEGLTAAFVAVVATLKVQFAKAITLGTSIGEVLNKFVGPVLVPVLNAGFPREYEKWSPVIVKYGLRYLGITFAWYIQRVVSSVFSGMRGSSIFLSGLVGYLLRHQYLPEGQAIFSKGNPVMIAAWGCLAFFGVWMQLSTNFRLPFPLNLIFLPVTLVEHGLVFVVGVMD